MPELPEVETVLRTLEGLIQGEKIADIDVYNEKITGDPEAFRASLTGQRFRRFLRRGKYLLFEMDDCTLMSHLRMEGKYYVYETKTPKAKHTHVIFTFESGRQLHYNDVRQFGRMEVLAKREDYSDFHDLSPEPLSEEFNESYLAEKLAQGKRPMKEVLLDQSVFAGVGNIYADEILFDAKIHPLTAQDRLNGNEIATIVSSTKKILSKATEAGGTTIRSYTSSLGVTGLFQLSLAVHEQKACPLCGTEIRRIRVSGRSTYYCPSCQKQKRRIAITGTIGSGKSTVSKILREKGYPVLDADGINRALLEKGNEGYLLVREAFPECFEGEELDKKKLSLLVFSDPKKRKQLEGLLHPLIMKTMIDGSKEYTLSFAEVPLLFEGHYEKLYDDSLLVVCTKKTAIERLRLRGLTKAESERRIKNQMPVSNKKKLAGKIIYNNGSLQDLEEEVEVWLEQLC